MPIASPLDLFDHLRPHLADGITPGKLIVAGVILSVLLGVCSWTDLFRDRFFPNAVTGGLLLGAAAAVPLLYPHPAGVYANAAIMATALVVLAELTRGVGYGDIKVYVVFALLLGPLSWMAYLVSVCLALPYGLPMSYRNGAAQRKKGVPMGPAIALSLPVTLALVGVDPALCAAMAGVMAATTLTLVAHDRWAPKPTQAIPFDEAT